VHRIFVTRPGDKVTGTPAETADDAALPALLADPAARVWVDMSGAPDAADMTLMRDVFKFHPLAIEDCFESREQPKIDEYPDYLYVIAHGLTAESGPETAEPVELDAFVGARFLVTYHDVPSRSVVAVTETVERPGLPLGRSPMTTLHAILDRQADGIETVMDRIADRVDQIEEDIFRRPSNRQLASALAVKGNILHLRRWMAKQREVVLRLGRREFPLVDETEARLFRDLHDHLARYTDTLDSFREMLSSIQEAYLSIVSNRLNEVMKFLTLFTTALMPLTVITGLYGMNFEHMPELKWRYGYLWALSLMAASFGATMVYFWRRGWLGSRGDRRKKSRADLPSDKAAAATAAAPQAGAANRIAPSGAGGAVPTVSTTPSRGRS